MNHASEQQAPTGNGSPVVVEVIRDFLERREHGIRKYGTELRTENGRSPLLDAYQEASDLTLYLKQALMERENNTCFTQREATLIGLAVGRWCNELAVGTHKPALPIKVLEMDTRATDEELYELYLKISNQHTAMDSR